METTLLFKTMIILTFELSIAFGLCIYSLKAAKRAALAGKPFFGIDFTLAVNMKNEIDLIPDSSRNVKYPRKMTKFVEVSIEERKNPSKKEYTTLEVFASNRDEAIAYLKDGYSDPLYMPPQLAQLMIAWFLFSFALLISSIVPVYDYYLLVGMVLFTISNICLGPLLGWIMLMMDENDGIRALKLTLIITFIAGFIGYSDIYSFAQDKNFILIMFLLLCGLVGFNLINLFRSFSRDTTRYVAIGGAVLFSFFIILDFNRLVYLQDLNVNDWNTAFYMSYSIYLDIINLLLEILEAMGE